MNDCMRRTAVMCCLAFAVGLTAVGCGDERSSAPGQQGNFSLEQAREFRDFELYAPGETYGELPLTAVLRRFDSESDAQQVRANFVDFIYGSCDASAGGCVPPLSVQVWAACERNPLSYDLLQGEQEAPVELRGVPAYFYEGGRRLELSTGASTVVIFAAGRDAALAVAAALEGVNNRVGREDDLPAPAYTRENAAGIGVIPCAYEDPKQQIEQDPDKGRAVEEALASELEAGAARNDNPPVREVDCFRSPVPTRMGALTDAHECMLAWKDGSFLTWCVLSGEVEVLRGTLPVGCQEASNDDSALFPVIDAGSNAGLRWGAHAEAACLRWREKEIFVIGQLDEDVLIEDLSYVWFALRPYEAGIVRDVRMIPGRAGAARKAVALSAQRVASIDAGLSAWQQGDRDAALRHFDRAEDIKHPLVPLFERVQAGACSPP
jgi:hypothetical protein